MLHPVHIAVLAPSSERLAFVVEENTEETPQQDKRGVCHDRRNEPISDRPIGDELAEPISPHVLVYRDSDEKTTSHLYLSARSYQAEGGARLTGLYESTAYVLTIPGRAATWIPAQV